VNEEQLHRWYFSPGEVVRSVGFYINPYKSFSQAKFRHTFAFDGNYNLYVAQFSIYPRHIDEMFNLEDKREYGLIYPKNSIVRPLSEENLSEHAPVVEFEFLETKNIMYLNKRLRPMAQRLYDYGLPPETFITSNKIDLWYLTIKALLKDKYLERPKIENRPPQTI